MCWPRPPRSSTRSTGRSAFRAASTAPGCSGSTAPRPSARLWTEAAMSTAIKQQLDIAPVDGGRIDAESGSELILAGSAPAGMRVAGALDLSSISEPFVLPEDLTVRRLTLRGSTGLAQLPRGLRCYELDARQTALRYLPDDIQVEYRLDLEGCAALEFLPEGLKVGSLDLRDCTALTALPEGLDV